MIHTKNIKFTRYGEAFEAIVTWDDQPLKNLGPSATKAFWKAKVIFPKEMDIEEQRISAGGFCSRMGLSRCNDFFVMIVDDSAKWGDQKIKNIYPWVIDEILYSYYNTDCHAFYSKHVEKLILAIDNKYAKVFESLHNKRQELLKKLNSEELDSKSYQIQLKAIRIEKKSMESKLFHSKNSIEKRYFECCKLKKKFQNRPGKVKRCPSSFTKEPL